MVNIIIIQTEQNVCGFMRKEELKNPLISSPPANGAVGL